MDWSTTNESIRLGGYGAERILFDLSTRTRTSTSSHRNKEELSKDRMHLQMDENTAINLISLNANGREAFCEDEKASIIFDWWVRDGLVSS